MKIVILAGGFGSRLSEYTKLIPKPMVKIGNLPIISHIIKIYEHYGFTNFILATGYSPIKYSICNIKNLSSGWDRANDH